MTDENECLTGRFTCPEHASCNNTFGDYECICNNGYEFSGPVCIGMN